MTWNVLGESNRGHPACHSPFVLEFSGATAMWTAIIGAAIVAIVSKPQAAYPALGLLRRAAHLRHGLTSSQLVARQGGAGQEGRVEDMAQLRVMSSRGDKTVIWDREKVEVGDSEATAAVREAERIFAEERSRGATAFKVEPGKPAMRLDDFDRTAEQTIIVPRIAGG